MGQTLSDTNNMSSKSPIETVFNNINNSFSSSSSSNGKDKNKTSFMQKLQHVMSNINGSRLAVFICAILAMSVIGIGNIFTALIHTIGLIKPLTQTFKLLLNESTTKSKEEIQIEKAYLKFWSIFPLTFLFMGFVTPFLDLFGLPTTLLSNAFYIAYYYYCPKFSEVIFAQTIRPFLNSTIITQGDELVNKIGGMLEKGLHDVFGYTGDLFIELRKFASGFNNNNNNNFTPLQQSIPKPILSPTAGQQRYYGGEESDDNNNHHYQKQKKQHMANNISMNDEECKHMLDPYNRIPPVHTQPSLTSSSLKP